MTMRIATGTTSMKAERARFEAEPHPPKPARRAKALAPWRAALALLVLVCAALTWTAGKLDSRRR